MIALKKQNKAHISINIFCLPEFFIHLSKEIKLNQ